jgi:hypothetical protein
MKAIFLIIAFVMGAITMVGFFPSFSAFIFANGSDVLMNFAFPSVWLQVSLVLIFGVPLFMFRGKLLKRLYPALALVFVFWIFSGRTFGIFPDGRIVTGWFYVGFDQIEVCRNSTDCEKTLYYETSIESLKPWRIRIRNKEINSTIFIGPVIWSNTLHILSQKCGRLGAVSK